MKGVRTIFFNEARIIRLVLGHSGVVIVTAVILVASISGVVIAFNLPTEIEETVAQVSYQQEGKFDYIAYLKPSYLFGSEPQKPPPSNLKCPSEIIDSIDMSFTYTAAREIPAEVEVKAILENPGMWQKEITLVPKTTKTGYFSIDFPLDIDGINELFDTIDEEIKITSSKRQVTIVASVDIGNEVFTYRLPIILGKTLIEVDSNLKSTQSGSTGEFDYSIHLKGNILFDTGMLKPSLVTSPPRTVGAGELMFYKIVDRMDVTL